MSSIFCPTKDLDVNKFKFMNPEFIKGLDYILHHDYNIAASKLYYMTPIQKLYKYMTLAA